MVKRIKLSAPAKTPNEKSVAESRRLPDYEALVGINLLVAAPGRLLEDEGLKDAMSFASYDLYKRLEPRDAGELIIALLAVGITNASLDCLAQAAHVDIDQFALRDLNLRYGLKGAAVVADLIKALNDLRGEKPEKVTVGNVNVEAGGQAIVGTVEAPAPTKGQNNK